MDIAPPSHPQGREIFDEPGNVAAVAWQLELFGPDGVDIFLTPGAAAEMSNRLMTGAARAQGQLIVAEEDKKDRQRRQRED